MKRFLLFALIILSSLSLSTVSAEIITRNHYQKGIEKTSQRSAPYNDQFTINSIFKGGYMAWVNQDGQKGISTDPYIKLEIFLESTDNSKPEEIQLTNNNFVYLVVGENKPYYGTFTRQSDGYGHLRGSKKYSVYGDNNNSYGVYEHYDKMYIGPRFEIDYYSKDIYHKDGEFTKSFCNVLINSIKTGNEIIIQIPYANNKHNITEQKYINFMITKETLAEWKEVSGF